MMSGMSRAPHHDRLAVVAVLAWIAAALVLVGQAMVAGDDMVLLQLTGQHAGSAGSHVAAALVGAVLLGVCVATAARISTPGADWPTALLTAGVALVVLAASLLAIAVSQASIGMSVADAAGVGGATAPGQWITDLTALVVAAAAVPCLVVGTRRLRGARAPGRRTPV
jgi:hypothetical protein